MRISDVLLAAALVGTATMAPVAAHADDRTYTAPLSAA